MSAQHTPGPWCRLDTEDYAEIHLAPASGKLVSTSRTPIALVAKPADADLIAAAPELLEALIAATWDLPVGSPSRDNALAAIAKARGNP